MEDKVGLTLACLNLKKLVKIMAGRPFNFDQIQVNTLVNVTSGHICLENFKKRQASKKRACLLSEAEIKS